MAQSDLECAKIALAKVGAPAITALADTTETAIVCNLCIDPLKKALLRSHPWNFAVKRKQIEVVTIGYTLVTDGSPEYYINAPAHGLVTGDWITISGDTQKPQINGRWQITKVNDDSIELIDSTFEGSAVTGDGLMWKSQPPGGYTYIHAVPSDFLRLLRVDPWGLDYRLESGLVATDTDTIQIKYIYNVTDYTTMDVAFYELLSTGLAAQICYKITQSSTKEAELKDEFKRLQAKVRFDDATEDPAEAIEADDWINSRFGSPSGWPMRLW